MSCDPTFEWCNQLQADPTAPPPDATVTADQQAAAADTAAADKDKAAAAAEQKGGKKGPPRAVINAVAVRFVNAMWATMFARVLSQGLQEWTRSTRQYSVQTTAVQAKMNNSAVFTSYQYQGYMLIGWGLYGWTVFLLKRFMKQSDAVKRMTLMAAQGNGIVGLALLGLSLYRSFGRKNCSTDSDSWQCYYDNATTDPEKWANSQYQQQSRTDYLLALQMMWLSKTTVRYLSADLKFKEAKEEKADAKAAAKDGDKSAAAADQAEAKEDATEGKEDLGGKLVKALEFAAWGL